MRQVRPTAAPPCPIRAFEGAPCSNHDLHHLATGYNTVLSEGEIVIAAYEIGAGCGRFIAAWVINLWGVALGLFIRPREMFGAFARGRRCKSLYRHPDEIDRVMAITVDELRREFGLNRPPSRVTWIDRGQFVLWSIAVWMVTLGSGAIVIAPLAGIA